MEDLTAAIWELQADINANTNIARKALPESMMTIREEMKALQEETKAVLQSSQEGGLSRKDGS
jgi:hypothetical protein